MYTSIDLKLTSGPLASQWTAGDAVNGRPPLSRWRDEYKDEFEAFMKKDL